MPDPLDTGNRRGKAAGAADTALQATLCSRLWESGLDVSEIALDVAQGHVTLRGAIGSAAERNAVEACVRACAGVRDIVNCIEVAPDRTGG
ncbi:BON domain-containing protein [Cupriavidus necator]|uniref:BON domain-containing protein n=1 Tax=Cupriavidus necator TaxID=106590 RepID=UPI00278AD65A|nr:BON domain-containing protein [Cupriavidus necator]MDQ0142312.1 osmotically-inducible protein OsmY [Cupriavidus necator]